MIKNIKKWSFFVFAFTCVMELCPTLAMDEYLNASSSQNYRPQWQPDIVAISKCVGPKLEDTHIKIFGRGPIPIFDFILPKMRYFNNIILAEDDTFFIRVFDREGYIIKVKDGKILERQKYGMDNVEQVNAIPDGTIIIRGTRKFDNLYKDSIITLKDGNILSYQDNFAHMERLYDIVTTLANTYYIRNNKCIVEVKDGKISEPQSYGLSVIRNFTVGPDGILYISGEIEAKASIVTVKNGEVSQPQSYGLSTIFKLTVAPDGTLCIVGKVKNEGTLSIVMIKDGKASEPRDSGLIDIHSLQIASDATVYLCGRQDYGKSHCFTVKDGKISLSNHGLNSVWHMYLLNDDTLFLEGEAQQENNKAIMVKNGKSTVIEQGIFMSIHPIIYPLSFEKIFKKEIGKILCDIDIKVFKALCEEIQTYPAATSHEDGILFYKFFARNILEFQVEENTEYVDTMDHLLSNLTNRKNSFLYGYARALSFELNGLEAEIFLHDKNMSVDDLIAQKLNPAFEEQFKRTKEAQEILGAIVTHTSSNFAQPYERLLEKVNAALQALTIGTLPPQERITQQFCQN
ncbi:MAG: hypothetical protein ACOH2E_06340 [Candidatus Paracaedibacter sp.]